jgi:hypothetical protein
MKKQNNEEMSPALKKLSLNKETLRQLTSPDLMLARGAGITIVSECTFFPDTSPCKLF